MRSDQVNICFHGIGRPARELERGEDGYWISEETFAGVLDAALDTARDLPAPRISFDDGNASDATVGLPALLARGLSATFFVLAGRLDTPGSLSTGQVRELLDAGMGIGTHGMDHRPWVGLDRPGRERELVRARDRLRDVTGVPVDEAALPLGRYDRRTLRDLRDLGYRRVHTSDRAWARSTGWLQPRFSLRATDTVDSVRRDVLRPPPLARRVERSAVQMVKRWR